MSVLIVEYGYFNNAPSVLQPSSATSYQRNAQFNITSVPQTELDGYKQAVFAACCVGGGSTIVCLPCSRQIVPLPEFMDGNVLANGCRTV